MAKAKATIDVPSSPSKDESRHWEVEDALHVLRRAGEIVGDKKLMADVKKLAAERADEMNELAAKAGQLAKMGRISEKAMKRMEKR